MLDLDGLLDPRTKGSSATAANGLEILACPDDAEAPAGITNNWDYGYAITEARMLGLTNGVNNVNWIMAYFPMRAFPYPEIRILVGESDYGGYTYSATTWTKFRHTSKGNFLFMDGHVETRFQGEVSSSRCWGGAK